MVFEVGYANLRKRRTERFWDLEMSVLDLTLLLVASYFVSSRRLLFACDDYLDWMTLGGKPGGAGMKLRKGARLGRVAGVDQEVSIWKGSLVVVNI